MQHPPGLQVYLVGGAVRDHCLGLPVKDKDWVVMGQTPASMLELGFQQVGRDFPVFLHPETGEEYALARTERKAGVGYRGFEVCASPDVTLEEDLRRRDLTINAMAMDNAGNIIDPYGGQQDCRDRILRHVSSAFGDDPLRLVRCARFYATLPHFTLHAETLSLLRAMAQRGELMHLSAERVWAETQKAIAADPKRFFEAIDQMQAWFWWQELGHHDQSIQQLDASKALVSTRWGALGAMLSTQEVRTLCERLRCDQHSTWLMLAVAREKVTVQGIETAAAWWSLLKRLDAVRRPDRARQWAQAWVLGHKRCDHDFVVLMDELITAVSAVSLDAHLLEQLNGPERGRWLEARRLEVIEDVLASR